MSKPVGMDWISTKDQLPPAQKWVPFLRKGADEPTFGFKESNDPTSQMWTDVVEQDRDGCWSDVFDVEWWFPLPDKAEEASQ